MARAEILLERESILGASVRLLDRVGEGGAGVLFALAEAGLGKTTALDYTCQLASERGFTVGRGCGETMEASIPFGLLHQAFAPLGGGAVLALEDREPLGPDRRGSLFFAARRWLESRATGPVLLAVDDLHWADPDSLALLSFLSRRLSPLPIAVIGTLRPWPPSAQAVAAGLVQDGYASIERLGPLTKASAGVLLTNRVRREVSGIDIEQAWEVTAGNPLLLEQVALAVGRGEGIPRSDPASGGHVLEELLLARFAGLPAAGMRCAQAAAVFGVRFRPELAVQLAQLDESEADTALDALDRSGLVRGTPGASADFVHPLFRQAIYDDLGLPIRIRLHARAFHILTEMGLDSEAAEHAIQADMVGDAEAIRVLARAGRGARRAGAHESAVRLMQAAVHLGSETAPELLFDLAEAMVLTGRSREAVDVCERVLDLADLAPMTRARTLRALAQAFVFLGVFEAATTRVEESVKLATDIAPTFAAQTLLAYGSVVWHSVGPARALSVTSRARQIAQGCSAAVRRQADNAWAVGALETGDPSGLDLSQQAARAEEAEFASGSRPDFWDAGSALASYASAAKLVGRLDESEHFYRLHLQLAEELGLVQEEAWATVGCTDTLIRRLRLDEALVLIERCTNLSDLIPFAAPFAGVQRVIVLLLMGRHEESDDWRVRIEPTVTELGAWWPWLWLAYAQAWRWLSNGHFAEACELYAEMEATATRVGIGEPGIVPWAGHAIAAYVGGGREDDARRLTLWVEDCARRLPSRWPRIAAAIGWARLAESAADHDEADRRFRQAVELHREVDLPLERLQTLLEYGKFLRRAGQPERSRQLLAEAVGLGESTGAVWLTNQSQEELRVAGGRRRRRREDPRSLTPQEQRVAELAASGATNRDIARRLYLSVSTIETHLERIYTKLDIHSRRELMVMTKRPGATPGESQ
ncbi:MAG TPA: LuxR C-terminal-related transcriptional regulator [Acidimicrobiales bacterium]